MDTVKFCNDKLLDELKKVQVLAPYIEQKEVEIASYNDQVDSQSQIDRRRLTNIGLLREYIELFLEQNPNINQNLTLMVSNYSLMKKV